MIVWGDFFTTKAVIRSLAPCLGRTLIQTLDVNIFGFWLGSRVLLVLGDQEWFYIII